MRGKRAAKTDPWSDRDWKDLQRLLRKAGGREQLIQRIDEEIQKPQPKRERRRIVSDKEFLAVFGDWFANAPRNMRKKFIGQMWQWDKEQSEDETLPPHVRKAWDPRRTMGAGTVDSIERRLKKRLKTPRV